MSEQPGVYHGAAGLADEVVLKEVGILVEDGLHVGQLGAAPKGGCLHTGNVFFCHILGLVATLVLINKQQLSIIILFNLIMSLNLS